MITLVFSNGLNLVTTVIGSCAALASRKEANDLRYPVFESGYQLLFPPYWLLSLLCSPTHCWLPPHVP